MIHTTLIGSTLVVTTDNPPVNALGHQVRAGLQDAILRADGDETIKTVVIACAGRTFFAGADITEFGQPPHEPSLTDLVNRIEACAKPVVAAIFGTALGGGLELAMACHYRIAVPSARLGLPEVKLGIMPGAGGTQRLPRLVGLEVALQMCTTGDPIAATQALELGLIDRLAPEGQLEEAALAFANTVKKAPLILRRTRDLAFVGDAAVIDRFANANARKFAGFDAPPEILKALRAAVELSFADGCAAERSGFEKLRAGPQAKAMQHTFFAERAAARVDSLPQDIEPLPIRKVGILGAGTMGGGIAMNFLSAGIAVTLLEREQAPLDKGVALIRRNYERTAQRGRITAAQVEAAMALLTPTLSFADLADCDLVIEAVFELMDIKKEVFGKLDSVMKPGAILATNTSYLDVDAIAAATRRPESVVGLHFFSPANVMKLLEVVRGARTAPQVLATAMAIGRKIGKIAVVAGVCHGFIGNRMLRARQEQAIALSHEGASPAQIDDVLLAFGFPMGPFQMSDLAGLDIGWDPRDTAGRTVRECMCEAGLLGQKTGHGFYDYDADRNRTPSPVAQDMILRFAAEHGIAQRLIGAEEVRERLLYPVVNEGALILEEAIAQRASDVDTVWVNGYGWPRQTGGPMFWADTLGLDQIVAGLEKHRAALGADFRLSGLLADNARQGKPFNG